MDSHEGILEPLRKLIIKLQRVGRHWKCGLVYLVHKLKQGLWTSQSYSSARYIVTFPRSMKNKIHDLLETDLGMRRKDAMRSVQDFLQTARAMIIRLHCPQMLASKKLIRLL